MKNELARKKPLKTRFDWNMFGSVWNAFGIDWTSFGIVWMLFGFDWMSLD
jgi:hypothetical protein